MKIIYSPRLVCLNMSQDNWVHASTESPRLRGVLRVFAAYSPLRSLPERLQFIFIFLRIIFLTDFVSLTRRTKLGKRDCS